MEDKNPQAIYEPFVLPNGNKVRLKKPSVGDIERVNLESAAFASQLIKDGRFLTKQELVNVLESKTNMLASVENKLSVLAKQVSILEKRQQDVSDPNVKAEIVQEINDLQSTVIDAISDLGNIYGTAIEQIVEQRKRLLLMQLVTLREDGSLYWPNFESLMSDEDLDSFNVISLRFSEVIGLITLSDEQREALNILATGVDYPLSVDDMADGD